MAVAAQVPPTSSGTTGTPAPVVVPPIPPLPPDALPTPRAPRPVIAPTAMSRGARARSGPPLRRNGKPSASTPTPFARRCAPPKSRCATCGGRRRWSMRRLSLRLHGLAAVRPGEQQRLQPGPQLRPAAIRAGDRRFDRVIAQKSTRSDAALYYKAYSQWKLGRPTTPWPRSTSCARNIPKPVSEGRECLRGRRQEDAAAADCGQR